MEDVVKNFTRALFFLLIISVFSCKFNKNPLSSDDDNLDVNIAISSLSQTNGPFSGYIQSCVVKGNNDLVISTFRDGVYESSDNGYTWVKVVNGLGIGGIATSSDGTQWAIAAPQSPERGVYKSLDNGETWMATNFLVTGNLIAVDKSDNIYAVWENRIEKSEDFGANWYPITDGSAISSMIRDLVINNDGDIFVVSDEGISRSIDAGDNWEKLNGGLPDITIFSLAINSQGDLFAGTNGDGIFRSLDNGTSWEPINKGLTSGTGYSIQIDNSQNIFVGGYGAAFHSTDNGENWQSIGPEVGWGVITTIAFNSSNHVFLGSEHFGIFRSTNNLATWHQINNGIINSTINSLAITADNAIWAGTIGGVFVSANGHDWQKCPFPTTKINGKDVYDPDVQDILSNPASGSIFVATRGLYCSRDNGENWTKLRSYFCDILAINSDFQIFVVESGTGLNRSNNDGLSWQRVDNGLDGNPVIAIGIAQNGDMYVATSPYSIPNKSRIFFSDNAGTSWQNTGSINMDIRYIVINGAGNIFAASFTGVFYSKNKGKSWEERSAGLSKTITSLKIDSLGALYVGTLDGAFVSGDNGKTWESINSESPELRIYSIALDYKNNFYVGTDGKGVFKGGILR